MDSINFVHTFLDPTKTNQQKAAALQKAFQTHTQNVTNCANGQGFACHLLALFLLAYHRRQYFPGYKTPSFFKDPTWLSFVINLLATSNYGNDSFSLITQIPDWEYGLGIGYFFSPAGLSVTTTSFKGEAKSFNNYLREALYDMKKVLGSVQLIAKL